ncbi:tripartite tricarboxylate transporter permease, partial [Bacteroides caccae]|uniref:tripartite tricarboxylate transporter permease n=1 Tax=Bacteroides caccae TaxID=47678 RepID=UPI001D05D249
RAVAAPEAANNAASQASMVPLLSLGIPNNVITSMILGAFIIHGVTPGPMLIATRPDMFWGIVVGMLIANVFLFILNVPLV